MMRRPTSMVTFGIALSLGSVLTCWLLLNTGRAVDRDSADDELGRYIGPASGIWGNHTAPLDWCETNYAVTDYVAEFHNTWTCSIFVLLSYLALTDAWRGEAPPAGRAPMCYYFFVVAFLLTGLTSALFHGTLWCSGQKADEIFEQATLIALLYMRHKHSMTLTLAHSAAASLGTVVLEEVFTEMHVAFLVGLLLYVYGASPKAYLSLQPLAVRAATLGLIGWGCWLLDKSMCHNAPGVMQLLQLHSWWHFGTALAIYQVGIHALLTYRLDEGCALSEKRPQERIVLWQTADYSKPAEAAQAQKKQQ